MRCRQGPDLGGVNLRKCCDFSQIRCFARTDADALISVHRGANQLVRRTAQLRVEPVGWRRLDLPSSPTGTSKRSISELHFHARRGVEIEISLMLNSCALHDSRIGCALLGHVSATLPRLSQERRPLPAPCCP